MAINSATDHLRDARAIKVHYTVYNFYAVHISYISSHPNAWNTFVTTGAFDLLVTTKKNIRFSILCIKVPCDSDLLVRAVAKTRH